MKKLIIIAVITIPSLPAMHLNITEKPQIPNRAKCIEVCMENLSKDLGNALPYMHKNPYDSKALIIKRYCETVINNTLKDLSDKEVSVLTDLTKVLQDKVEYTPCDGLEYDYILTGESSEGMGCCQIMKPEWDKELKKIQQQIDQESTATKL